MPSPQNHHFSKKSPKLLFLRFFKNNTPKHSSNMCLFHVPKANKIHRGISKHSSVQTTINNHAKSPKSPFFQNSPKVHFLRIFKINTPMHSSNICSVYVLKENKIYRGISENSSVQTTINNHANSPKSPFFKICQNSNFWDFSKIIRLSKAPIYVLSMCQRKTKSIEG